jgi:hypothetical protein
MKKFLLVFLCAVMIGGFAMKSHAITFDELMLKVQGLEQQVTDLKAKLGASAVQSIDSNASANMTASAATVSETPAFSGVLKFGKKNEDIKKLQEFLISNKFLNPGNAGGTFGKKTREAIQKFQKANILPITGIIDEATLTALNNSAKNPPLAVKPCGVNTAPWVQVTSPNGGESYAEGDKITVKWKTCNIPANTTAKLSLLPITVNGTVIPVPTPATFTTNSGSVLFMLPEQANFPQIAYGNYYKFHIDFPSLALSGDDSNNFFIITPTVVGGPLDLVYNKNLSFGNQTISGGTNIKIGSYVVTNSSTEPITVHNITISSGSFAGVSSTDLTNLTLKSNGAQIGSTKATYSTVNIFNVNFILAVNASQNIDVYADIANLTSGNFQTLFGASGIGQTTAIAYPKTITTAVQGQTMTIGVLALCVPGFSLSPLSPPSALILNNSTNNTFTKILITNNCSEPESIDSISIDKQGISNWSAVHNLSLYNGLIQIGSTMGNPNGITLININNTIIIPQNSSITLDIRTDILGASGGQTIGFGVVGYSGHGINSNNFYNIAYTPGSGIWGNIMSLLP